jgi:hypothetical protein
MLLGSPGGSSPPSVAMSCGASLRATKGTGANAKRSSSPLGPQSPAVPCPRATARRASRPAGHRRACGSLFASFAAGVAVWNEGEDGGCQQGACLPSRAPHPGALIATFPRDALVRCRAFADARRVVPATKAARADGKRLSVSSGSAAPPTLVFSGRASADASRFPPYDPVRDSEDNI